MLWRYAMLSTHEVVLSPEFEKTTQLVASPPPAACRAYHLTAPASSTATTASATGTAAGTITPTTTTMTTTTTAVQRLAALLNALLYS